MFASEINSQQSLTLAAGVAGSMEFDVSKCKRLSFVIENRGASNPIGTTVVETSPDGAIYSTETAVGSAIGSLAASSSKPVTMDGIAFKKLKLTFTSASGSDVRVTLRAV